MPGEILETSEKFQGIPTAAEESGAQDKLGLLEWEKSFFNGQKISRDLQREIDNHVQVIKVNGTWICFYSDEVPEGDSRSRINRSIHQSKILNHFVDNPNTEGVVIEYFAPELKNNARNSSLLAKPFIQSSFDLPKYRDRIFGYNYLAILAKNNHKDVYVTDIANKPAYQGLRVGWAYGPGAAIAAVSSRPSSPLALAISSLSGGFLSAVSQEIISRVTPNKNKLEDVIPTPEDARRVFIAKGIQEITHRINDHSEPSSGKTLLVVYPEAHINRIIGYIENKSKKEGIYKATLPGLDYSVRRYRAAQDSDRQTNRDLSGWQLVEEMPL